MEVKLKEKDHVNKVKNMITGVSDGYVQRNYPLLIKYQFFTGEVRPSERYKSRFAVKRKGG